MTKLVIDFIFLSTIAIFRFIAAEYNSEERKKVLKEYQENYKSTLRLHDYNND